ncbi:family 10 glycosylhydrolase [Gracilibacillus oryzae]|uniref:Family 10 glycosylhydrolase n=1 Tax=Gracilibacillus oryzae TaxID=1672701 RepID=A0A7C8KRX7_9BACI|nr:alpha-amylase family protein [Gracilibacillus oryzae]KAB8133584.1 family 10 glycosylhydrolase [Gracilibacillus oryzae]
MNWWSENQLRLIQTNISEVNADLDVDLLIQQLKDLSANTLMLNTGGIEAFYPTKLAYHYQSPYLKKDLIREAVRKCRENDIKFIARFDFSKAHETIYLKHPDWFYQSKDAEIVNYNQMVHTCVNGYYQQEYSLKIIEEVIDHYPVDGIFFNMFGYQTRDYSNNYFGICHCHNCQERFQAMFGHDLPVDENPEDKVYQDYLTFKRITTKEMLERIHDFVKTKNKNIAISTYADHKVDIVRNESNTAVDRPYPKWMYSASENVQSIENTWRDKLISNCVINAVDIFYRFVGVSKHEVKIRLYESIASGSGLDFCIIGVFDDYPDRNNLEAVKEVFAFHEKNQQYFGNFTSVADVLLIKPNEHSTAKEYLGIYKMLKEEHIIFDVLKQDNLADPLQPLEKYKLILFPNMKSLNEKEWEMIQSAQIKGVHLIATGQSFTSDVPNQNMLHEVFGGHYQGIKSKTRADYLEVMDKKIFPSFLQRDWIFLDGNFTTVVFDNTVRSFLPYIKTSRFGPPERVGGHQKNGHYGMGWHEKNDNINVYLPWNIGYLYYQYGYEDHKRILADVMDQIIGRGYIIESNAPESVEIFLHKYDNKNYILQLLNLSGFNGTTYHEHITVSEIDLCLNLEEVKHVNSLVNESRISYEKQNNQLLIKLDQLDSYEALILKT